MTVLRDAIGRLHDVLRDLEDPDEIAFQGTKLIGETLGVSRAGYGTINKAEETITIERDWNAPGIKEPLTDDCVLCITSDEKHLHYHARHCRKC